MANFIFQIEKVKEEIIEYSKNPQHLLLEAIHSTGYSGPYGHPLMASQFAVERLNNTVLEEFVAVSLQKPLYFYALHFHIFSLVLFLIFVPYLLQSFFQSFLLLIGFWLYRKTILLLVSSLQHQVLNMMSY